MSNLRILVVYIIICTDKSSYGIAVEVTSGYSYKSNPLTLTTAMHFVEQNDNFTMTTSDNNVTTVGPISLTSTTFPPNHGFSECSGFCNNLSFSCYICKTYNNCTYGLSETFSCKVIDSVQCTGNRVVMKKFMCKYCYLMIPDLDYSCEQTDTSCNVTATPKQRTKMNCIVKEDVFCLGNRRFSKMTDCNWTSGYKWSTALILSITLGGLGVDRFYLGYWREGLGKLFSFGGLGVWTLIDITLIATSYLGPYDDSLYI